MCRSRKANAITSSERSIGIAKKPPLPKYLAYALPRAKENNVSHVHLHDDLELHDVPLRGETSFLDFDGVVLFAGAFERVRPNAIGNLVATCVAPGDLDFREREYYTTVQKGRMVVFLVPKLPRRPGFYSLDHRLDLFRRVIHKMGVHYNDADPPVAHVQSDVTEFEEFIERYGTAYMSFELRGDRSKRICGT